MDGERHDGINARGGVGLLRRVSLGKTFRIRKSFVCRNLPFGVIDLNDLQQTFKGIKINNYTFIPGNTRFVKYLLTSKLFAYSPPLCRQFVV